MAAGQGLSLAQQPRQQQRLHPRHYQEMDLIHMPLLDLRRRLDREMEENPFLDVAEHGDAEDAAPDDDEAAAAELASQEESAVEAEADWEALLRDDFSGGTWSAGGGGWHSGDEESEPLVPAVAQERSLWDHLREQLGLLRLNDDQRRIGQAIVGSIDLDGFLATPTGTIAESLGVGAPEVEEMLARIQTFEPSGVGARDLRETLLLQLRDRGREESLARSLVRDHFQSLAKRRWRELGRELGVSPREVQAAADEIRKLDPKPGLRFADLGGAYVRPDLTVRLQDGEYRVSHDDVFLPRLRLAPAYRELAADPAQFRGEQKAFVKERLENARWLIGAIEGRRRKLVEVMECIVNAQRDFLDKGVEHLRPLMLRDVADRVGLHESTISRISNRKYVQTPRGLFSLKFFFAAGYATDGGGDLSARAVRARVGRMIGEEEPTSPLSDQAIANLLATDGVRIARKTVAKYREQLGILSARMRRRL